MVAFRTRSVAALLAERRGLQRVTLDDGSRAYVLTALVGPVAVGDRVIVNTTAVDLRLGTGGWHVVHWNLTRDSWEAPGPGSVMKLRYTSLQVDAGAAEEEHVAALGPDARLPGTPVVACGLHSQVGVAAVVARHLAPEARLAYVMTDGAALPLALSDLVAALVDAKVLDITITAGQAFGGDREAVNVPSALVLAGRVEQADVVLVGPGPGVVGTRTALGNSPLEVAPVVDAADALGGHPIVAVRYSDVDPRARHRGVSAQTVAALMLARSPASVPIPAGPWQDRFLTGLAGDVGARHRVEPVEVPDVATVLGAAGVAITTMGRTVADDPGFFRAAAAAAVAAVRWADGHRR